MTVLAELAAVAKAVLFDFDGPLCDVFAGLPADQVAEDLAYLVQRETGEWVGAGTDDPMEILRRSARFGPKVVRTVEDALIEAELTAVSISEAEVGGLAAVRACTATRRQVAIVSNNSAQAVEEFLARFDLTSAVTAVIGRAYAAPHLMKPDPMPLRLALAEVGEPSDRVLLIGDSLTDIEVCSAVGVPCVAFANKPGKIEKFSEAPAVISNMEEMASALGAR